MEAPSYFEGVETGFMHAIFIWNLWISSKFPLIRKMEKHVEFGVNGVKGQLVKIKKQNGIRMKLKQEENCGKSKEAFDYEVLEV